MYFSEFWSIATPEYCYFTMQSTFLKTLYLLCYQLLCIKFNDIFYLSTIYILFTCYFTAQYTSDLAMERPAQYEELMKYNLVEPLILKQNTSSEFDTQRETISNQSQKEDTDDKMENIKDDKSDFVEQQKSKKNSLPDSGVDSETMREHNQKETIDDKSDDNEDEKSDSEDEGTENDDDSDDVDSSGPRHPGYENKPGGTHFIYTLCKAADELIANKTFDVNKWVFLTNSKIGQFINMKYCQSGREVKIWQPGKKSWTKDPKVPECTIQLTKELSVSLPHPKDSWNRS